MIIVDTNVIAYYLIPGSMTQLAEDVRGKDREWAAPPLWRSEMRNVLGLYVRNGQIDLTTAQRHMSDAEIILSGNEFDVESDRVLDLSFTSGCTAYDCEFIYLTEKLDVPLVTTDRKLLAAFPNIAMSMGQFLNS